MKALVEPLAASQLRGSVRSCWHNTMLPGVLPGHHAHRLASDGEAARAFTAYACRGLQVVSRWRGVQVARVVDGEGEPNEAEDGLLHGRAPSAARPQSADTEQAIAGARSSGSASARAPEIDGGPRRPLSRARAGGAAYTTAAPVTKRRVRPGAAASPHVDLGLLSGQYSMSNLCSSGMNSRRPAPPPRVDAPPCAGRGFATAIRPLP